MGFIICVAIILLVGIIAAVLVGGHSKGACVGVLCGTLVLALVLTLFASVTSIPTGYTGILTTFGRVENRTLDAGFNMKSPWQKSRQDG